MTRCVRSRSRELPYRRDSRREIETGRRIPIQPRVRQHRADEYAGNVHGALGKFSEAEPIAKASFLGHYSLYGSEAPITLRAQDRLDRLYEQWGEPRRHAAWREELQRLSRDH